MQNHDTCSYFSPLFCSSTFSSIHSNEKWWRLCSFCVKLEGKSLKQESMPWQEEKRSLMIYYNELFNSKVFNQSLSHSVAKSLSQPVSKLASQLVSQSVTHSVSHAVGQSVGRSSVSYSFIQLVSQSVQKVSRSVSQSVSWLVQSVSQPFSQSVIWSVG